PSTAATSPLSLHDALPICATGMAHDRRACDDRHRASPCAPPRRAAGRDRTSARSGGSAAAAVGSFELAADADRTAARGPHGPYRARPRAYRDDFTASTYLTCRS